MVGTSIILNWHFKLNKSEDILGEWQEEAQPTVQLQLVFTLSGFERIKVIWPGEGLRFYKEITPHTTAGHLVGRQESGAQLGWFKGNKSSVWQRPVTWEVNIQWK